MSATYVFDKPILAPRRTDGEVAREKLLMAALELFARDGFSKTSTRQIAALAGANVGAIAYYFGDKLGLYRAAFIEPLGSQQDAIAAFSPAHLSLHEALVALYAGFLSPLKQGVVARWSMKLHLREMVEPTGVWAQEITDGIVPYHRALVAVLSRDMGIAVESPDLHRLAISIVAQGVFSCMAHDAIEAVAPQLFSTDAAIDAMGEHYTRCAMAMVAAEKIRINLRAVPL